MDVLTEEQLKAIGISTEVDDTELKAVIYRRCFVRAPTGP